jgi:hypothetical protein
MYKKNRKSKTTFFFTFSIEKFFSFVVFGSFFIKKQPKKFERRLVKKSCFIKAKIKHECIRIFKCGLDPLL